MNYSVKNTSGVNSVDYVPTNPPAPSGSIGPGLTQSITGEQQVDFKRDVADQATVVEVTNPDTHKSIAWTAGGGPRTSIAPGAAASISLPALPAVVTIIS